MLFSHLFPYKISNCNTTDINPRYSLKFSSEFNILPRNVLSSSLSLLFITTKNEDLLFSIKSKPNPCDNFCFAESIISCGFAMFAFLTIAERSLFLLVF
eukprot:UN10994